MNIHITFKLLAVLVLSTLVNRMATAQVPRTISYQGRIEQGSTPLTGKHLIHIAFYDATIGGGKLYEESHQQDVTNGLFTLIIGSVTPIPVTVTFDKQYYLGITIDGGEELVPRTALTSTPYALNSQFAELAQGLTSDARGVVTSINEVGGAVRIMGDSTTSVTQNGNIITIHSIGGSGTGTTGIQSISSPDKTIAITGNNGPLTTIGVADSAITSAKLATGAVTTSKIANGAVTATKIADGTITLSKLSAGVVSGQIIKWNGTNWILAADSSMEYLAGQGISISGKTISATGGLPTGTVVNSTLRWNGTAWTENTNLQSDVNGNTTIKGTSTLGDGTGADNIILKPGSGTVTVQGFTAGVVKSNNTGNLSVGTVDLTTEVGGILPVSRGGTGVNTLPVGRLLLGNGTNPVTTTTLTAGNGIDIVSAPGTLTITNLESNTQWKLLGNGNTNPANIFLGTTDANPLVLRTNNTEKVRIDQAGMVGIGTAAPSQLVEMKNGNLLLSNTNTAGSLMIAAPNSINTTSLTTTTQTANITYVLPPSIGVANHVLSISSIQGGNTAVLGWTTAGSGNAWNLTGNSGTSAGTNFIGTTDNQALVFRANTLVRLQLNTSGSIQRDDGGNARGVSAVDLQNSRTLATQVASGVQSVIAGGIYNTASGINSVVGGGFNNVAGGSYSIVSGGIGNDVNGNRSSILGGAYLRLGVNSAGFNNETGTTLTDLSALSNLAYFGNVDLFIGNTSNTARELRFYEPNTSFTYAGTNFTSFKAGTQSSDIIYTLPVSQPTVNQVLSTTAITGTGPYNVTLGWAAAGTGNAWNLTGNSGTTAGTNFIGTTDNQALYLQVKNASTVNNSLILNINGSIQRDAGGSGRGAYAVDLQLIRANVDHVATGQGSTLSGGKNNSANGYGSVVAGGEGNGAGGLYSSVGGGIASLASADYAVVSGGYQNYAGGIYSLVSGGIGNQADGSRASILGGGYLRLGANSVGYNYEAGTTITNLISLSNLAYFGNINVMVGNTDNTARELRFFEPNTSFSYTGTNFSSFKAVAQSSDIIYTLPSTQPSANQMLSASSITGTGPYSVALTWADIGSNTAWNLTGNSATTAGTNFLGTTDNQRMFIQVKNASTINNSLILNTNWSIQRDPSGNTRGANAIDLQNVRFNATSVASGDNSTISGGEDNTASASYSTIAGGKFNNASGIYSVIGGGTQNILSGTAGVISGGYNNTVTGDKAFVGSGENNYVPGDFASIVGGASDTAIGGHSVITGGYGNNTSGDFSAVVGGMRNRASGDNSTVVGGFSNAVGGIRSSITGGGYLRLTGNNSFGFNGGATSSDSAFVSSNNTAFFGNVNMWLGNTNNAASQLRFYEAQNGGISFPGGSTNFSSFAAASQSADINYALPSAQPSANQVLTATAISGSGPYNVTLGWANNGGSAWALTGNSGTTAGTNFIGTTDNQALDLRSNNIIRMRLNTNASIQRDGGGNARGVEAIDMQVSRSANSMVSSGDYSAISGGMNNTASGIRSTVIGGVANVASNDGAIAGGYANNATGFRSLAMGGTSSTASGSNSVTIGGIGNAAGGLYSTILGGGYLTLTGNLSFGVNSFIDGSTTMSVSADHVAVFGNADLWLANTKNAASQLKFFEAQSSNGTFPAAATNFSSFKAGSQNADINYTLPTAQPLTDQVLTATAISGTGPYNVMLGWANNGGNAWTLTGNSGTSAGTNFVGTTDNQALDLRSNNVLRLRLNTNSSIQRDVAGNARGNEAVDLQLTRIFAYQVASGDYSVIMGGGSNIASGTRSVVLGGVANQATNFESIAGGNANLASGPRSTSIGGTSNSATGDKSLTAGGNGNTAAGDASVALGGGQLTMNGDYSFGFNASLGATGIMTISASSVAVVGNADLWLANTKNNASQLKFFEAQSSTGTFPAAATNFSSFKAGSQSADINYTLPTSQPSANQVLAATALSGSGPYNVTLGWANNGGAAWNLTGNSGTTPGTNFLGTIDNQPFEIRIYDSDAGNKGSKRVMRYEPNATSANIIGGYNGNSVTAGITGATISGGGGNSFENSVTASAGTVTGGYGNTASGTGAVVSGIQNTAAAHASVIAGGNLNYTEGNWSSIAGGYQNSILGSYSTIVGGKNLRLGANSFGFNADVTSPGWGITYLNSVSNVAYFGNVNIMIGHSDGTPRELRFYGTSTNSTYSSVNYVALKAGTPTSTASYILPNALPVAAGNLLLSGTTGTMNWSTGLVWDNTNSRLGVNTTSPSHPIHSINSATTDEVAAIYGNSSAATSNQVVAIWGDASNAATSNTGTIGVFATGNGNTTAGQTNIALQVNDGEFTMGRTTEAPGTGNTANAATAGSAYSAQGPSGVVELTLGAGGNLATAAPTANTMQSFAAVTINNRYCQAGSIVLINIVSMADDGNAPDPRDAGFIANVDNTAAGSFSVRLKMIPSVTNATNYTNNDKIKIGYMIVNASR